VKAGVTDAFLVELQTWPVKATAELLEDFLKAGIVNHVQAFKIKKALCFVKPEVL